MSLNNIVLSGGWYKLFPSLRKYAFKALIEFSTENVSEKLTKLLALINLTKECSLPLSDNLSDWRRRWVTQRCENVEEFHRVINSINYIAEKCIGVEFPPPVEITVPMENYDGLLYLWFLNTRLNPVELKDYLITMEDSIHNLLENLKEVRKERPELYQLINARASIIEDDLDLILELYLELINQQL